ncbi:MAG: hypothetical protein AAF603_04460, partial [Pseudomonadota bacterium]
DQLSQKADRLLTTSLDKDLLEERVRSVLGLVRPEEMMVRIEDIDRLAAAASPKDEGGEDGQNDPIQLASLEQYPSIK